MTDSLGYRMKFAVVAPSTNTSVEPEYADMRPRGVTNHFSRIAIPDTKVVDDATFVEMLENIRSATFDAVDVSMSMDPGCVVMGMSAETFWDGAEGAERLHQRMLERTGGVPVIMGSTAVDAAIRAYGEADGKKIRKIGILTPYAPVGDANVKKFFEDQGYEVVHVEGLKCQSPMLIAHESKQTLKRAAIKVSEGVDAVIQAGTNLAFAEVAAMAEFWLEKPVIAINTATYWHALRTMGFTDQKEGFGRLLADF
ncbi:maleate cis-trans isomerase family protein [Novosphingobium resinovorum]|uniref:Arylmalonate decarboxylase n=1 Tax=Novosphingobium resinovorum TaxID=158500 RepID=A0A031JLI4_9SPHN|nr:arylmalonate decarboxylase [Novosphingobium resinovorum]AOR79571.1 arylmalonate decarboxylase [Novosphingobium resinovorum]EZP75695.1 Arylmalonate decarboxylase [Novosphingobium resinovorum]